MSYTDALHEWRQAAYKATRERDQARASASRIQSLHAPYRSVYDTDGQSCAHCNQLTGMAVPYPCETIRAIEGQS